MTHRKILAGGAALCALLSAGAAGAQTPPEPQPVEAVAPATATATATAPARPVKPTIASLTAELDAARATIAALDARASRQALALDNARAELKVQRDAGVLKDELLVLGRERNAALYKISQEILDAYVHVDLREAVSRREPFVQARRVALENEVQAYEDRLREARIFETTLPPSVERRMQEELSKGQDAAPAADAPAPQ